MPSDAIVSLGSPGAGRSTQFLEVYDAGQAIHTMRSRGGVLQDMQETTSNLGFASGFLNQRILKNNASAWQLAAQSFAFKFRLTPVLTKPGAQFAHTTGLHVMETLMLWDVNPAAGESGLMFGPTFARQPLLNAVAAHASCGVVNNNGVLRWISRSSANTFENPSLMAFAGPLNNWNKIRIEVRSATLALEASVTVFVNDKLALTRSWGAGTFLPDLESLQAAFVPYFIQADAASLYYRDFIYFDGPNTPSL